MKQTICDLCGEAFDYSDGESTYSVRRSKIDPLWFVADVHDECVKKLFASTNEEKAKEHIPKPLDPTKPKYLQCNGVHIHYKEDKVYCEYCNKDMIMRTELLEDNETERQKDSCVQINPNIQFGAPQIRGITTEAISDRFQAGESIYFLADDYDLKPHEVNEALRFELKSKRKY